MITGTTSGGFEFSVSEEVFDDYELLEMLCDIDNGGYQYIPPAVRKVLGHEQTTALKEHIRKQDGKVSAKKLLSIVMEIFESINKGKNS